ncbi:uncharacterized protein LOC123527408 isoform X1 [Mercenaria mercenaria]|uniref:uncharacterized protein LOC123527408 isoform X1 n=1 Tax=Mercenaria mercenaria TaxID=6596 RepID=UPI00234F2CC8|nr:uncharacterized protein LOC123527408 isoform X1 [Mercenaria mercenaria]
MESVDISSFKSRECEHFTDENDSLLKFIAPATLLLVGQSNSGKTSYMRKLVEMGDRMFTIPPSKYIWLYNMYQDLYDEIGNSVPNVQFEQGLPTRADIQQWAETERHLVLILDDLYHLLINSRDILDLFVLFCHHLTVTVIISCHNIFMNSKYAKTMTTNLHYILLFRLQNRLQLSTLGTQLFVHSKKSKHFLGVYDDVMATDQYSPLIIDLSPQTKHSDYKLQSNILPGQLPVIYELE